MSQTSQRQAIENLPFMLEFAEPLQHVVATSFLYVSAHEELDRGAQLIKEGDTESEDGFVLMKGSVLIQQRGQRVATVYAPALLGEMKQFNLQQATRAGVVTAEESGVLRFTWNKLYAALNERLSDDDIQSFRTALERYAWQHFFGDEI